MQESPAIDGPTTVVLEEAMAMRRSDANLAFPP
jgi:hypothetical protein